ncbi:hypothetical protein QUF95_30930 [Paenibacillus silvae]|nr:hypothetical protein [Paenibacillus silvae]
MNIVWMRFEALGNGQGTCGRRWQSWNCRGIQMHSVGAEIRQLLVQAKRFEWLGDQKDRHEKQEAIRYNQDLQREASALRGTVQHNQSVLARQRKELEEAKEEAVSAEGLLEPVCHPWRYSGRADL